MVLMCLLRYLAVVIAQECNCREALVDCEAVRLGECHKRALIEPEIRVDWQYAGRIDRHDATTWIVATTRDGAPLRSWRGRSLCYRWSRLIER